MFEAIYRYLKGLVERPEVLERFNICTECDQFNKEEIKCQLCGCYVYAKVQFPISSCPQGKW